MRGFIFGAAKFFLPSLYILYLLSHTSLANAQTCPPDFGNGKICTAKDFTVTGVVISGPDECTVGDTLDITVRIGLESTAKQRYDIGLFAGDDGGEVIGGSSCSFTSLAPIEPDLAFNADSGFGGYRDLDGDACGDVSSNDGINYRNFELDSVLCKDEDGDGQLDLAGLVTWSSNANQDVCSNPDDPTQFFPSQSSKCLLDPNLNIPITVEPPPTMSVVKTALPSNLPEPGGAVEFLVDVFNTSSSTDVLTITSMVDDVHGDLNGQGTCSVPQTVVPGGAYFCRFTATVSGSNGYVETDTVTVEAVDDDLEQLDASDSAAVTIADLPASITVKKTATPRSVREPGGPVVFTVLVANDSSSETVTLTELTDSIYGDLAGEGTCPATSVVLLPGDTVRCFFRRDVTGQPGDPAHVNVATVTGTGPGGTPVTDSDDAAVTIRDVPGEIEVTKYAVPAQLPEPGGIFNFTAVIQNTSPVDSVTIDSINDDIYGDLTTVSGSNCVTPQVLDTGEVYECTFPGEFLGRPGSFQVDIITVTATDDDGGKEEASDAAQVDIIDVPSTIEVVKTASPTQAETGDIITFSVSVLNTSAVDAVSINTLDDDIYGDITVTTGLIGSTSCSVSQLVPPGDSYDCEFTAAVIGSVGQRVTDVVFASGVDDNSLIVTATDDATVEIISSATPDAAIELTKVAAPQTVAEKDVPRPVLYAIIVRNPSGTDLTVTSLLDDIYDIHGDDPSKLPVNSLLNCPSSFELDGGASRVCLFTASIDGFVGDVVTDIATVEACPRAACSSSQLIASDDASVSIVADPASIIVLKTAFPTSVATPGGPVEFTVEVINNSATAIVTIDQLVDDIHGDITSTTGSIAVTNCSTTQVIAANGGSYECRFTADVLGFAGQQVTNEVTASGKDDNSDPVEGSDLATVEIIGTPPLVDLRKSARPLIINAPGGPVTFSIRVRNTSALESLEITSLMDDVYGSLDGLGSCELPQTLAAGEVYTCEFVGDVAGTQTSLHADTIVLQATDESGDELVDQDSAYVVILVRDIAEAMQIPVSSAWWLLATSVLLTGFGVSALPRRRRNSAR
jgi:hypothetical protein